MYECGKATTLPTMRASLICPPRTAITGSRSAFPSREDLPVVPTDGRPQLTLAEGTLVKILWAPNVRICSHSSSSFMCEDVRLVVAIPHARYVPFIPGPSRVSLRSQTHSLLCLQVCFTISLTSICSQEMELAMSVPECGAVRVNAG